MIFLSASFHTTHALQLTAPHRTLTFSFKYKVMGSAFLRIATFFEYFIYLKYAESTHVVWLSNFRVIKSRTVSVFFGKGVQTKRVLKPKAEVFSDIV